MSSAVESSLTSVVVKLLDSPVSIACTFTLVCLLTIIVFQMASLKRRSTKDKKGRPPGPTRYPVVGNLLQLTGEEMFYVKLNEMRKSHGDVLYLELGVMKMLVVFGHDEVNKVLTDQADRFKFRPIWLVEVKSLELTNGIVWSNGIQNEKLRHFAVPAVHPGLGEPLERRVQVEASMLVKEMLKAQGDSAALKNLFYQAICNINCGIIFGSRYEYTDTDFQEFISLMDQLLQRGGVKNPLNFFPILQMLPENKKTKCTRGLLSKVAEFIHTRIESARATFDRNNTRSLIDLWLAQESDNQATDHITEENLCHIVRDFFVAGTENVAIALVWAVGYMAQYPDIQTRCRECVKQALGNKEDVGMDDVPNMAYVEATINEMHRMASIAPLSVPHAVQEDVEFEEFTVPKDTMVITHLQSVHMDSRYWDNPETFQPDRFLQDNAVVKKEAFYPYSIGSRYCLAQKLAQMEIHIIFSTLLNKFVFAADENGNPPSLKSSQPGAFVEPETFDIQWKPV